MHRPRYPVIFALLILSLIVAVPFPALVAATTARAQEATAAVAGDAGSPVFLLAAPGLEPALVTQFAAEGAMPALAGMAAGGTRGSLVDPVPATAGVTFPTLLTGTWPAEHGIVGERFYRTGSPDFADWAGWDDAGLIQADTLPQAAERAGKVVAAVGWDGIAGLDPALAGPVIGEALPFSQAGVVTTTPLPEQLARAEQAAVAYEEVSLQPAEGWGDAPESYSPAQETEFTVRSLDRSGPNPDRTFGVYIYDSTDDGTVNYDGVVIAEEENAAQGTQAGAGAWASVPVTLGGDRDGEAAGFWLKVLALSPDLSDVRLYYTPVSRREATWNGCADHPGCAGLASFEEFVNEAIGPALGIDAAPLEAGLIDGETFVEQGITSAWQEIDALRLLVDDLGVQPDLLLMESSLPGAASRPLLGALSSAGNEAMSTPVPEANDRVALAEGLLRESYAMADEALAVGSELLGPDAATIAVAPGGSAPSWLGVDAGQVLADVGLAEAGQPENCVPAAASAPEGTPDPEALPVGPAVKACWSGGTAHIYINLDGREAAGSVAEDAYDATREAIVTAFNDLHDPENPEAAVVNEVALKEDLRGLGGTDLLHPSRAGDVVVVLNPPYRFTDATNGEAIAPVETIASDGYLLEDGSDMGGQFLAAGPGIATGTTVEARVIDIAPTAAYLLGVPGPNNASGSILLDLLANGQDLRVVTLLDISDFHGQLPPLSAAADDIEADGAVNSSFDVGGVAVLAPWFDHFRAEAPGEVLLVTAGDAVGATPPISTAFQDVPTIEVMNALGFTADGLGNHNFDAGAEHMFGTLEPIAEFTYLSANLVPARADLTPPAEGEAPFRHSMLIEGDGVAIGLIGFSNPDIPNLTRPGALDPYRVIDPVAPVNEEAASLRDQGADVVIAMGHMGATGGTLSEPTGPVVEMAEQLQGVDVVVGDHTDVQVSAVLGNGVLLVENRSKGVMFTRVQAVVDSEAGELVYLTADHHRPWAIGMTPDPELVEQLEQLEEELAPVLGRIIGSATRPIPRSDACGGESGRLCESLVGNIITDALRLTYGTDFALTNSGGIRSSLTCPPDGGDFCPIDAGENQITEGQVLTVLPFGNVAVTLEVTGAELKAMLEAGVASLPESSGAFPQVSGFCFTYNIEAEPGNRVTGAVRQAADGMCSGEPIDLTEGSTYTLATNDFTAAGGDSYPELISKADSRDILAAVVSSFLAGETTPLMLPGTPIDPQIEGRIVCEGEGCPVPVEE